MKKDIRCVKEVFVEFFCKKLSTGGVLKKKKKQKEKRNKEEVTHMPTD